MKTIGMLGGMSWQSTLEYYRMLNQDVQRRLGGLHSARCVLVSMEFHALEQRMQQDDWDGIRDELVNAGKQLQSAGADFAMICTNTMHKLAPQIEAMLDIPLLHIADAVGEEILSAKLKRVGLLGSRFTMQEGFYRKRLENDFGLEIVLPPEDSMTEIDRIIFSELCAGQFLPESRDTYLQAINSMKRDGAQGIILGCTELALLIRQQDTPLPLFDSTRAHARAAVSLALA